MLPLVEEIFCIMLRTWVPLPVLLSIVKRAYVWSFLIRLFCIYRDNHDFPLNSVNVMDYVTKVSNIGTMLVFLEWPS